MRKSRNNAADPEVRDPVVEEARNAEDLADETGELADQATATDGSLADADAEIWSDERLSELQRELTTERDKHLRLVAEFDNFRKRMIRERADAETRGKAELARQILDSLDDIARFAHVDPAVTDSTTIVQGVEMVEKKLGKSLRAAGLELVNPVDEKFDPSLHEAVATDVAEEADMDGTVSRVYQVGYTFNGQLLRPARVVVRQHAGSN